MNLQKLIGIDGSMYILIDCFDKDIYELQNIKKNLSYFNKNININGMILLENSDQALFKTTLYNKDFSNCNLSGNALITLINHLYNNNKIINNSFLIETDAGLKEIFLKTNLGLIESITINLGKPSLTPRNIPVLCVKNIFINEEIIIGSENLNATCISLCNPHTVIIDKHIDKFDLRCLGPKLEFNHIFPNRTNIEFTENLTDKFIYSRIWERGNSEVSNCITGAGASVVALTLNNKLKQNNDIKVVTNGGIVNVNYRDNDDVYVTKKLIK